MEILEPTGFVFAWKILVCFAAFVLDFVGLYSGYYGFLVAAALE